MFSVPGLLEHFTIFNPTLGGSNDVKQKIIYSYPQSSEEMQLREVGFVLALMQFCKSTIREEIKIVRTRKTKSVLLNVEGDYWFLLKVNLGANIAVSKGRKFAEYLGRDWETDDALIFCLSRIYSRFAMFYKSFVAMQTQELDPFFTPILFNLDFSRQSFFNSSPQMRLSPLSDQSYRKIRGLSDKITAEYPDLLQCIFWKDTLTHTTMGKYTDIFSIYDWITDRHVGKISDGIVNQVKFKGEPIVSRPLFGSNLKYSKKSFTGYLVDMDSSISGHKLVFVSGVAGNRDILTPCLFAVYQYRDDFTFCFICPIQKSHSRYEGFAAFLKILPQIVASDLKDFVVDVNFKSFSDFENMQFVNLDTIMLSITTGPTYKDLNLTKKANNFLLRISSQFTANLEIREVILHSFNICVIGIRNNRGLTFLVISRPELTLGVMNEEIRKFKAKIVLN